jgi:hypothetical protein
VGLIGRVFRRPKLPITVVTMGRDAAFEAWSHGYGASEYAANVELGRR